MPGTKGVSMTLTPGRYESWRQWQSVIYGVDAGATLITEMERAGAQRVGVLTTPSLVREKTALASVVDALGDRWVGTFGECRQYVPRGVVMEASAVLRAWAPDLLLSVGGGSVVDTAKGVAMTLCEGLESADQLDAYRATSGRGSMEHPSLSGEPLPIFSFPTTLSGAEYTGMIGITNPANGHREPFRDDRLSPRTVFLDPSVTLATPHELWCATGIKILSDAFEQYSTGMAGPVMEPLTLRAFDWLIRYLPDSTRGDVDARLRCQVASWLTLSGVFNAGTKVGIGAAIRHQLGMLHAIPHGLATCGILREVVRASAPSDLERRQALLRAARADAPPGDEAKQREALASVLQALLRSLDLPTNLADLGLGEGDLDLLADRAAGDFAAKARSARVWTPAEVRVLLGRALR